MKIKNIFKDKKLYKSFIFVLICIAVYSWTIVSCLQMWLNCAILDYNMKCVEKDISKGVFTEVSEVDIDGNFTLVNDTNTYSPDDISSYIRVPNGVKYYYNTDSKEFVAPETINESVKLVLQFIILDIISTILLIVSVFKSLKKEFWSKLWRSMFLMICIFISQIAYSYAFDLLFNIPDSKSLVVGSIKIVVFASILIGYRVIEYIKFKKPNRLTK